jgi:two-component system chemotaxis response regulator CheY
LRILIAEDDFAGRRILQALLSPYGECDIAVDGEETVYAFTAAVDSGKPYDLICLDIMMPKMDGREALRKIRSIEDEKGVLPSDNVKIIMTTALDDPKNVVGSFKDQCEAYIVKPIEKEALLSELKKLKLIT